MSTYRNNRYAYGVTQAKLGILPDPDVQPVISAATAGVLLGITTAEAEARFSLDYPCGWRPGISTGAVLKAVRDGGAAGDRR